MVLLIRLHLHIKDKRSNESWWLESTRTFVVHVHGRFFSFKFCDSWWRNLFLWAFGFYFCTRPLKMSRCETKLGHFERWWLMFHPHDCDPALRAHAAHAHAHTRLPSVGQFQVFQTSMLSCADSVLSDICGDICAGSSTWQTNKTMFGPMCFHQEGPQTCVYAYMSRHLTGTTR